MSDNDLERQFMKQLREAGLDEEVMENLLQARLSRDFFRMLARDMRAFSDSLEEKVKE